jgi:hypothetical protein
MFKILGCNDEQTTCDKCGKTNLKKTVVLDSDQFGIVRYGVDCAALSLKGDKKASSKGSVDRQAKAIERTKRLLAKKHESGSGYAYNHKIIVEDIWNLFGYSVEDRKSCISIQFTDGIYNIFRDGSINFKSHQSCQWS